MNTSAISKEFISVDQCVDGCMHTCFHRADATMFPMCIACLQKHKESSEDPPITLPLCDGTPPVCVINRE